jgi:hypothetical protein
MSVIVCLQCDSHLMEVSVFEVDAVCDVFWTVSCMKLIRDGVMLLWSIMTRSGRWCVSVKTMWF